MLYNLSVWNNVCDLRFSLLFEWDLEPIRLHTGRMLALFPLLWGLIGHSKFNCKLTLRHRIHKGIESRNYKLLDLSTTSHDSECVIKEDREIHFVLVAFGLKHAFMYADPYVSSNVKWA
jgi:hypothetical protein